MLTAVDDLFRRSITTLLTIYFLAGIALIVGLVFIIRALCVRTWNIAVSAWWSAPRQKNMQPWKLTHRLQL